MALVLAMLLPGCGGRSVRRQPAPAKLNLARRYHLGGVALWRLGMEDPSTWRDIVAYKAGR